MSFYCLLRIFATLLSMLHTLSEQNCPIICSFSYRQPNFTRQFLVTLTHTHTNTHFANPSENAKHSRSLNPMKFHFISFHLISSSLRLLMTTFYLIFFYSFIQSKNKTTQNNTNIDGIHNTIAYIQTTIYVCIHRKFYC